MSLDKVTFEKSDYESPQLESLANEIASFLYHASPYILDRFVDFMRTSSGITFDNYKGFIQKWFAPLIKGGKKAPPDIKRLKELCYYFFDICSTDDEIRKMRGLVPEKLFEIIFEKRNEGKDCNIGYGAKVLVNNKTVIYKPSTPFETKEDSDQRRQTVDAGSWDGQEGEFAEVKLQPNAFHTKDIRYLRLLAKKLDDSNICYCVFLITLNDKGLIWHRLNRLGLFSGEDSTEFLLIGKDELFQLETIA
ncbi:hypothetical protein GCM10008983_05540 [Lentibacillus halophilus]|uniref:Restriction endonuclease n=1 Tax=Lentibacillus halophilus TaxID=295065 RepID=A0ABP3IXH4_9BACI